MSQPWYSIVARIIEIAVPRRARLITMSWIWNCNGSLATLTNNQGTEPAKRGRQDTAFELQIWSGGNVDLRVRLVHTLTSAKAYSIFALTQSRNVMGMGRRVQFVTTTNLEWNHLITGNCCHKDPQCCAMSKKLKAVISKIPRKWEGTRRSHVSSHSFSHALYHPKQCM